MTTRLGVTVSHEATHTLVTLTGELDVISGERLSTVFGKLSEEGGTRLVVDASELTFCDSMGLRLLLEAHDRAVEAGGFMKLAGVRGVFRRILTVTGLHAAFPIYETLADALETLDD
ncbi:STAS domain-containing protein [Microbispora bryophytorum]|uniref:Anti-sigma factor antagonist n=2 Tax=Microbispora bryophytorum TaxID=1460882 RepID=A0A8H9H0L3_9ACTN|nr:MULTISPECIES: STAS domain-containing protein [Microbispora]MBD3136685.1 STAS domain-containing protein [Microbispora bryophytorum]MBD3144982.1 STAS domain-containing protein [Microbispora camponoti]TQS06270.1 STAS domain-containing protein [Microbispora bryophytorum]GGO17642.1 anti-sigma factor antagonist [Microbispora bryophytorum]